MYHFMKHLCTPLLTNVYVILKYKIIEIFEKLKKKFLKGCINKFDFEFGIKSNRYLGGKKAYRGL